MIQFFKNLFNLNKIVKQQEFLIKEIEALKIEIRLLQNKFNQITIQ